jgi:hypothetical protein
MIRLLKALSLGALCAGTLVGVGGAAAGASPAKAPPSGYTCTGSSLTAPGFITSGAYSSLTMPPDTFCFVVGTVTVGKPVTLGAGSALLMEAGSLSLSGPFAVGPGSVFAAFTNALPVTIGGPVHVGTDGAFVLGTESPYRPTFASIGGPVTATGASSVQIHNTMIGGPVRLTGGGADNPIVQAFTGTSPFNNFNDLEDDVIGGGVTETGYHGIWAGVLRDVINGPFTFTNNSEKVTDEYDIGSDFIAGPATCANNTPTPNMGQSKGSPSIVEGPVKGNQAATCTGVTPGTSGPAV